MTYRKFIAYNVIGGVGWVAICLGAGFFFGNLQLVKDHFSLVIMAIVIISVIPAIWGYFSARTQPRAAGMPRKSRVGTAHHRTAPAPAREGGQRDQCPEQQRRAQSKLLPSKAAPNSSACKNVLPPP